MNFKIIEIENCYITRRRIAGIICVHGRPVKIVGHMCVVLVRMVQVQIPPGVLFFLFFHNQDIIAKSENMHFFFNMGSK